ncbi:MipA/OmpV family protein [Dinoroseobacter sp. PD6]|uniref:MipA/OmpV family protein n=1 Tax=Dinoroseobacter sp. PD6 TaxID=3028384 RepID=UPI00237B22B1|nr:MipA/OmpV family protein [Dinoroseobacter sp. PD6]MDD9718489.1 MipA/OmpV family protein [Dinoroseobacter sp. PD6]
MTVRLLVLGLALIPATAQAQEGRPDGFSFGGLVAADTNPYIGQGSDVIPLPLINFRNGPFSLSTNGVSYQVWDAGPWGLTVAARPRFSGLISTDGPELDGIDRRVTGDAAVELRYDVGRLYVGADLRQEFTGEHDGQEARLRVGLRQQLGSVRLDFSAGGAWQDGDLSRYIWGVSDDEARAGRPSYDPGSVLVPFVGLRGVMPIGENWSLLGTLRADFLPDDVTDSPIIEDNTLISGGLGVEFRF